MKLTDDSLITPEIGTWGEEKYRLIHNYAKIFTSATKRKWACRVYIDLFSGAGRSRIKGTGKIVLASPLLALDVPAKFDKYIFCERNADNLYALQSRVKRDHPDIEACFLLGDANAKVEEIKANIPHHRKGFNVLSFCFVDPFKLDNLAFETIRKLSVNNFVDFLVLIPSFMDAHRNIAVYKESNNTKVDKFLGSSSWREDWIRADKKGMKFGHFLIDSFGKAMEDLKYINPGLEKTVPIYFPEKNYVLYHLAFFSRSPLGDKLWAEVKKYSKSQLDLF